MNIPFLHSATKANEKLTEMAAQLTEAKALVVDVTRERDEAKATIAARDAAAESCRAQFEASQTELAGKLSVATAQITQLQATAQTAGQQAAEVIAAQGLDPVKLPKPVAAAVATTMPRADYTRLSPADQLAFARAGGKLT